MFFSIKTSPVFPLLFPFLLLPLFPVSGQQLVEVELVSQTPTAPAVGATFTVEITAQHFMDDQDPRVALVRWCTPGQAFAECDETEWITTPIPYMTPQSGTLSFEISEPGMHELHVAMGNSQIGWEWAQPLEFDAHVPVPHATWQEAAEALQISVTHTPQEPVAHQPTRGNDHRDKITVTVSLKNDGDKILSPMILGFPDFDAPGHRWGEVWHTPAMEPGDSLDVTWEGKLIEPGDKDVQLFLEGYDGRGGMGGEYGHLLTTYTFTAVPLVQRTFTYTVTPDEGDHGDSFTFYSNYSSADGQPPQAVTLILDGEEYPMTRDPSYTDGMMYTYETTLDCGTHIFHSVAQVNATEEIRYSSRKEVLVSDPIPPTVGGPSDPDTILPPGDHIILEGTGADVGSGVAEVQSRLLPGGDWESVFWDDPGGWRVRVDSPIDDQEVGEFTVQVRAIDNEGNETPADQYYEGTVVFDFRHPKVTEQIITRATSETGRMSGLQDGPPEDLGPPRMGEPYLIAFKIENASPRDQEFSLEWKETEYGDVEVDWGLDMEEAQTVGFSDLSIPGGATKWIWMPFEHFWSWIPEKDWVDLIVLLIEAYDGDDDTNEFVEWAHTKKHLVSKVSWFSEPGDGVENLSPLPYSILTEIEVSPSKKEEFHSSYTSYCLGTALTAVGLIALNLPGLGALAGVPFLVAEAGFLVSSHFSYLAAYDPSPHFQEAVQVQEVRVPELEELDRDDPLRKGAEASLSFAAHAKAASEAYIRYLGAREAGDERSARARAQEAASFARVAAEEVEETRVLAESMVERIRGGSREERDAMMNIGRGFEIPGVEQRIFRDFGLSQKDYEDLAEPNQDLLKKVLDSPEVLVTGVTALGKSFSALAELMDQAAGGRRR